LIFFFQAEDGIRDDLVTGVQTCALPIFVVASPRWCPMPAARGEKIVRSVPRSRCTLSWPPSIASRISLSVIVGRGGAGLPALYSSEEHTSELQSPDQIVCRLLLEKKKIW